MVGDWIRGNLGPRGIASDFRDGAMAALALARQAPELAARAERLSLALDAAATHGLRFDAETAEAIGRAEARGTRSGRIALWIIAAALVWIGWHLA